MTTYTFDVYKVTYDPDTDLPQSFEVTTLEIVFDENVTPSLVYSILNAPVDELPVVEFGPTNEYDVRVDGISLNQDGFLDGENDETLFGTVNWDDNLLNPRSTQVLVLYDAEANVDYIVPLFGDDPGITSLAEFVAFDQISITGVEEAASPYGEGDSIDVSTSTLIAATTDDDLVIGTDDTDFYQTGSGDDTIFGNGGNDFLYPGDGTDSVDGGDGFDIVSYRFDTGPSGVIVDLENQTATDRNGGVDTLVSIEAAQGSSGNDTLIGAAGASNFFEGYEGDDSITGGVDGFNHVWYRNESGPNGIVVDLLNETGTDSYGNTDTLILIDQITGTNLGDSITGDNSDFNVLVGEGGNDTLIGLGGGDEIFGGDGDDSLEGGDGTDSLYGGAGNDYLNPGDSDEFDDIRPGSGNDTIDLNEQVNSFTFLYYGDLVDYYDPFTTGIVATLSGGDGNNDTILKNGTDTDTILGLDVPLYNDIGIGLFGTELADTFNLTNINGENPFGAYLEITGGDGADSYVIDGRADVVLIFDEDTSFNPATDGLDLNLATGAISNDGFGNSETITYLNDGSLARVRATNNNDSIVGSDADETFSLLGGIDDLNAGAGFDRLRYDQGDVSGLVVDMQAGTATGTIDWRGDVRAIDHSFSGIERVDGSRDNGDTISGSGNGDFIRGRGGDDSLSGNDGDDTLQGDEGNDTLIGGAGDDFFRDGSEDDYVDGGSGDDTFRQDSGRDTFIGGDGWDRMDYGNSSVFANGEFTLQIDQVAGTSLAVEFPTNGNDSISGIEEFSAQDLQIDVIFIGDDFSSRVETGSGADTLEGNGGDDTLRSGAGDDSLLGGDGDDELDGGDGDDFLNPGQGVDFQDINTGRGNDTVDLSEVTQGTAHFYYGNLDAGVVFDLDVGADPDTVDKGTNGSDTILGLNSPLLNSELALIGTAFDDTFNLDFSDEDARWNIRSGAGNDTFNLTTGTRGYLELGRNADFNIVAITGIDIDLTLANGQIKNDGFNGTDTISGDGQLLFGLSDLADTVVGGDDGDEFYGRAGADSLVGGGGDDRLEGDLDNDTLNGGDGDDFLAPGLGTDQINGGAGFDTLFYNDGTAAGGIIATFFDNANPTVGTVQELGGTVTTTDTFTDIERVIGTDFNDTLNGALTSQNIQLFGEGGDDSIVGGSGDDYFQAGSGNDVVNGGANTSEGLDFISYYWDLQNTAGNGNGITIVYSNATDAFVSEDGFGTQDTLISIEGVEGTQFADSMTGAAGQQFFRGLAGNDFIDGGDGIDWVSYRNTSNKDGIQGAILNFVTNSFTDTYGDTDTLISIENVSGSDFGDLITGNNGVARVLNGYGGNDTIIGGDQDDTISGGAGADSLSGGDGVDLLDYSDATGRVRIDLLNNTTAGNIAVGDVISGFENIEGGSGNDLLLGDAGDNWLWGNGNDDELQGRFGNDTMEGGAGADTLDGSGNVDTAAYTRSASGVTVNFFNNTTSGGDAAGDTFLKIDNLIGSAFGDRLTGNFFSNKIEGGAGADTLNGGAGIDTLSYESDDAGVTVDLQSGSASGGDAQGDVFSNFENLAGGLGGDTLLGDGADNFIFGGAGDDDLQGRGGNDTLEGGAGGDALNGGGGNLDFASYAGSMEAVSVSLASGATSGGDAAGDTFVGIEGLIGSSHNDTLTGDAGANVIEGGAGADSLNGGAGIDTLSYEGSNTRVVVDLLNGNTFLGHAEGDVFSNFENLTGSNLPDYLLGNNGDNVLNGGRGIDRLEARGGNDTLIGGAQNDNLKGGAGADVFVLRVGDGADVIADWEDGVDRMDLTDFGLSFAEIEALAVDLPIGAVRITLGGGDQFQINGFSTADLDVSDFV